MTPEKHRIPTGDVSGCDEYTQSNRSDCGSTDGRLSLFVVAASDDVTSSGDCLDPVSDVAWLQFIDGLDVYVVVGKHGDFFDTVVCDSDSPDSGIWLVDEAGTVRRQWALPSERRQVLSIGRTVERTIGTWGDAR